MTAICVICMELLVGRENVVTTCGHVFHRQCLREWFTSQEGSQCPQCRNVTDTHLKRVYITWQDSQSSRRLSTNEAPEQALSQQPGVAESPNLTLTERMMSLFCEVSAVARTTAYHLRHSLQEHRVINSAVEIACDIQNLARSSANSVRQDIQQAEVRLRRALAEMGVVCSISRAL
ncbi:uncharacterized protein LOC135366744 [Ornithodoros turicata]|uniref:uncharacterized protein LOC135366744 n=1 Tax=Ornithodoros turicata TaxID=34597 RepID=UPI003138C409